MKFCIQGLPRSILLLAFAAIAACGGGTEPIASPPTPFIMASVPAPAKKASTVTGGNGVVIHMYQALYGMAPSNALLVDYAFQANNDASTFVKNLTDRFASTSHADLTKLVLDNLGVTPTTVPAINARGESEYGLLLDAVKQLFAAYPTMRGQVILNMTNLLAGLESDATYGAAAAGYNNQASVNFAYSSNPTNTADSIAVSVAISPAYAATGVAVDTFVSIDVTTDSTLDASSITTENITLKAGTINTVGTASAVGTNGFKFSISGKLNYAQLYTFTATLKDSLGKALVVNGIFTTASAPRVFVSGSDGHPDGSRLVVEKYSDGYEKRITHNGDTETIVGTTLDGHSETTTFKAVKTETTVESDGITTNFTYIFEDKSQNWLTIADISKVATYGIPIDITKIKYPDTYLTTVDSTTYKILDTCNFDKETLIYPKSYIGTYPLPIAKGAPLKSSILRGASIKDSWGTNNASIISGCRGNTEKAELAKTFNRLKSLNVDYVMLNPWTSIEIKNGVWRIMNPGESGGGGMDDVSFEQQVIQAHKTGLQVHWANQIQVVYDASSVYGGYVSPVLTQENLDKFLLAYEPYMLERAAYLQRLGVDAMMLNCWCWAPFENDPLYVKTYEKAIEKLIPKLKQIYTGKLLMGSFVGIASNSVIDNAVDYIQLPVWFNPKPQELNSLNVALLKQTLIDTSTSKLYMLNPTKKYIVMMMGQSRSNYFTASDTEEGACSSGPYGTPLPDAGQCYQRTLTTDFSLQAMIYEAFLEFVNEQTTYNIVAVQSVDYLHTDQLLQGASFPNIAHSIRNKPAEGLLKIWFTK